MNFKPLYSLALCISSFALAEPAYLTNNQTLPFGQSVEDVKEHLETACSDLIVHENQALELPTATSTQLQIDCTDYAPLAHNGLSEWIFADNHLDIVWVLSPRSDLEDVKSTLNKEGITPDYALNGMADFYLERGFGIRYEPSEFLYHSERLTPFYRAWLESL